MKKLWTMILVVFMLCIGFSTVTYATDTNLDTPAYDAPALDVDFSAVQDVPVIGYTDLPQGPPTIVDNLYAYDVLPSAYRGDRPWFRCCNSNFYQKINGKPYSDGARYMAYTKSKTINLRT